MLDQVKAHHLGAYLPARNGNLNVLVNHCGVLHGDATPSNLFLGVGTGRNGDVSDRKEQ